MNNFNYSGENTLLYLFQMIKNVFVKKETGKGLSTNDYTTDEKNKLAGLKNYELPTASADTKGGVKIGAGLIMEGDTLSATGGGTADSVNWSNVIGRPEASTDIDADKTNSAKYATPAAVHNYVGTKMASALIYKGSVTFANLPALSAENVGHVYNVTDAFVTTANFLEGAGHSYAAGQNVAVADAGNGVYRYDVLAQPIDLSGYVQQEDMHEISNDELDELWESVFGEV